MVSKLRLGIVAVTSAAGIYVASQSNPVGDMATAPPMGDAPVAGQADPFASEAMPEGGGFAPEAAEMPSLASEEPAFAPQPAPLVGSPSPAPVGLPQPTMTPRSLAHPSSVNRTPAPAVDPGPSEIPQVSPRLPGGEDVVRVYYGTNRKANLSYRPDQNPGNYYGADLGALEYGVVEVSVPKTHQRGHLETRRWYLLEKDNAVKHFVLQRIVPTEESLFLRELNREIVTDPQREMFVFIHGFGTSFEAAAWRTGQLKADLEFDGPAVMYSWPSRGLVEPISYFRDRDSVRESHDELEQFLETIATQTGATKIHVIAHSMGNYLLAPTLKRLRDRDYLPKPLFDQLVLAAPDISAEMFEDEIAAKLDRAANRTTIYAADNDYALRISQIFNRNRRRLGTLLGIEMVRPRTRLEVVDTGTAEFRLFEAGHSDYAGPVLEDLKATIRGLNPTVRGLARHHLQPAHWELKAGPAALASSTGVVQVGHSEVIPSTTTTSVQPATKSAGFWSTLTSWWPW